MYIYWRSHIHIVFNLVTIFDTFWCLSQQPWKSREHWKSGNSTMLNEWNWHIFAPKSMTITNFNFVMLQYWSWKMLARLVIFIGFGAKIWFQLVKKCEIQNIFLFSTLLCITLGSANSIRWALSTFTAFNAHNSF